LRLWYRLDQAGISPTESSSLDLVRATAAVMVFLPHWQFVTNTQSAAWVQDLGRGGVLLFFVMSGFLIAATSETVTLHDYAIARLARLWSVALPVIFFLALAAVAIETLGLHAGDIFSGKSGIITQLVTSLTFTNRWWFAHVSPFSDSPYWSLSYEAGFYLIWGAAMFGGARRAITACAAALLVGPQVILLFPVWLTGALLYRSRIRLTRAGALVALPTLAAIAFLNRDIPFLQGSAWEFSGSFPSDWMRGLGCLLAIAALFSFNPFASLPLAKWIANRSFTLYLVHYPLLIALRMLSGHSFADSVAIGVASFAICLLLGHFIEPTARAYRRAISAALSVMSQSSLLSAPLRSPRKIQLRVPLGKN
jgi:peptidoglycan/LPS O-acetylase OafA/YrhL